jgi:hypothetical protein
MAQMIFLHQLRRKMGDVFLDIYKHMCIATAAMHHVPKGAHDPAIEETLA